MAFHHWIARRIKEYGFGEPEDYRSKMTVRSGGKAGHARKDLPLMAGKGVAGTGPPVSASQSKGVKLFFGRR